MKDRPANLREEIALQYRKHCASCTGSCCNVELEAEFVAFGWEFDKLSNISGACAADSPGRIRHVPFNNGGRCPFSGAKACTLSLNDRPLDCLTYPVYPQVGAGVGGASKLAGLTIRRGCRKVEEISGDKTLMELIHAFWEVELAKVNGADMDEWLCGMDR